jgi:hypothetical protein
MSLIRVSQESEFRLHVRSRGKMWGRPRRPSASRRLASAVNECRSELVAVAAEELGLLRE